MKDKKSTQWPLLLIFFIASGLILHSCNIGSGQIIKGDGNVITTTHDVGYFHNIDIQGVFDVELIRGAGKPVLLEADENLQALILLEVRENTLYVSTTKEGVYRPTKMALQIIYPDLESIIIGGACKLHAEETVVTDNLRFQISGAADIDLAVDVASLRTSVSGAASINLTGKTVSHIVNLSGASSMRAEGLISEETRISLSGAGSAHVYASKKVDASLSGVGSIRYYGEPSIINIDKSGIGSIRKAG